MFNLFPKEKETAIKDNIATLLEMSPEAMRQFEEQYRTMILDESQTSDNLFEVSAKQAANGRGNNQFGEELDTIINRIVDELLAKTEWFTVSDHSIETGSSALYDKLLGDPVSQKELNRFPLEMRPQLTGNLMKRDMDVESYMAILDHYVRYQKNKGNPLGRRHYDMFRQGLDILDLDPIVYDILGRNQNSIGNWLMPLAEAVRRQDFFKIPETTVIRVPMTLLQLSRCDYAELTPATMAVVDRFCKKVFHLDETKEYFVKTGTYSSKFDFRNCRVSGAKEVNELGEYLLYINFQAAQMASPLNNKQIYGVSTTNEWAVREYIQDKEGNPTIYKGMPLHTEYRVFADLNTKKILGVSPYWRPDIMERRFGHENDANSPHQIHDYIVYKAHEKKLMERYEENVVRVCEALEKMLPEIYLDGQWAIDVMQNGEDFWVIDMSLAQNSALVDCVPKNLLRPSEEKWLLHN